MDEIVEERNENRIAKILVLLLTLFLIVSWIPSYGIPLGNSHEGRVLGQFALHVSNFWELGILDSSFGASWEPFSNIPYTHHPPLLTFLHLFNSSIAGQGLYQIKFISYFAGIATIPALFWMGQRLSLKPFASVFSIFALIATPWWWVYGRLGLGFTANILMIGSIWALSADPDNRKIKFATAATFFAVVASWHGVFLAPFLWLGVWWRRKFDRVSLLLMTSVALGLLVVLVWVIQGGGTSELGDHFGERVEREWTWGEFFKRQWDFAKDLLPFWYLILAIPALVAGFRDIRTRFLTSSLLAMVLAFALIPADGAWIHNYWNFPVLLALFPGFAVLAEYLLNFFESFFGRRASPRVKKVGVCTSFLAVILAGFLSMDLGGLHKEYFDETADAGRLTSLQRPPSTQETAWHLPQIPWPTWISSEWNLPTESLENLEDLLTVPDEDIVLVHLDRLPSWIDGSIVNEIKKRVGNYGVVSASSMRKHTVGL